MKIDTDRVILEVRARPLLWHKRHPAYRSKEARDAAWAEICGALVPELEEYCEEDVKEMEKKIQQRWRTARDSYKKDKLKKTKYAYYDMMTFLDEDISTLGYDDIPVCTVFDETDDSTTEAVDGNDPVTATMEEYEDSKEMIQTLLTSAQPVTEPRVAVATVPPPPHQSKVNKNNITDFQLELLNCVKSSQLDLEPDDVAFFQSLKPALERLTHYQKMLFRTKVLQIIMKMEHPPPLADIGGGLGMGSPSQNHLNLP